jgi:hypothetical protein
MRTIVAFILASFVAAAQAPSEVDRLEKRIAGQPNNVADRQALLRAVSFQGGVPIEKARPVRREQILWLIAHQPDVKLFDEPFMQMWPHGRLADPDGYAQAAQLWREKASAPGASMKTIANAAAFFKIPDPAEGLAILDAAESYHPHDPDLARARGVLDAALILGLSGIEDNNFPIYTSSTARRAAPPASAARKQVESSDDANLVGGAGEFFTHNNFFVFPFPITFGDDDLQALAEKWLRRARQLAPSSDAWNTPLSNAIRVSAQRTNEPREKLRLLNEASGLLPENPKRHMLAEIAQAEFEASDDADAERDAEALLAPNRGFYDYHIGQTLLGRLALAHGGAAEAKEHLLASVKPPASIANPTLRPNMQLAQEILDAGDKDAVLAFLEASRTLWPFDQGRIDHMINFVKRSAPGLDLQRMANQLLGNDFRHRPAPDFEVKDTYGKTWTRDQLSGKVVALVFGSGPAIDKIVQTFSPRVEFFHATANREDPLARRFEVESDPTLVVIDSKGRVVSYLPGKSAEAAWRREIETGISGAADQPLLTVAVPQPKDSTAIDAGKATVSWELVDNAESYVVEWDSRDEKGWIFDREKTVRVIATRDTSATLDLNGFTRLRWRVYAVPRFGPGGKESTWREIEGTPVTKIYK